MIRHFSIAILLLASALSPAHAKHKPTVQFDATVVRIDKWGLARFSCGAMINYRLVEYRVDAVRNGHVTVGEHLTIKHVACHYNELNDLKVGDRVTVLAELLKIPDRTAWQPTSYELGEKKPSNPSDDPKTEEVPIIPVGVDPAVVRYNAIKVSKVIYREE